MFHMSTWDESPGDYVPVEDASTQTTEKDFFSLEHTRDASTQTNDEDFNLLKPIRDASTQTSEDDFNLVLQIQSTENVSTLISNLGEDNSETVLNGSQEYKNECDMVIDEVKTVFESMPDFGVSQSLGRSDNNEDQNCVQNVRMTLLPSSIRNEPNDNVISDHSEAVEQLKTPIAEVNNVSRCHELIHPHLQVFDNQVEPRGLSAYSEAHITTATPPHPSVALPPDESVSESGNHAETSVTDRQRNIYKESTSNIHGLNDWDPNLNKCDNCDGRFCYDYYRRRHKCVSIVCEKCHYFNNRSEKLDKYLFRKNSRYVCLMCGIWFKNKPAFYNHASRNCDPNICKCDKCGANLTV